METNSRRDFIKKSAIAGTGVMMVGGSYNAVSAKNVLGANDAVRVAIMGLGNHGRGKHLQVYKKLPGVKIVALCDVDLSRLNEAASELSREGIIVDKYTDIRKLLERKDIDAVSNVTPNHWHALGTVWACQAGKDVAVEKPVSHSIWEGRKMVEAARKYKRMVQGDFNRRSQEGRKKSYEYLQSGELGKVLYVKSVNYKRRKSIGLINVPQAIPQSVDYNLWCGPAPMTPLMRQNLHYDWHWQYMTGNAELGNNGPHTLDCVRWALGMTGIPQSVYTIGGRYGYMDNGDVPNSFLAVYEYEGIKIVYESRALSEHPDSENMDGLKTISATGKSIFFPHDSKSPNTHEAFICEHGILYNDSIYDNNGTLISSIKADGSIEALEHFIEAVKSRDVSDLRIDIDEGHLSTAFCHLGNISYKLGKQESLSNIYKKLEDHPFLMDSFRGFEKHLSVHGIDISEQLPVLGPKLLFDSKMEAFHGPNSNMANLFLKDTYREPFQIPEDV
jgi:predicted dehydrogenase